MYYCSTDWYSAKWWSCEKLSHAENICIFSDEQSSNILFTQWQEYVWINCEALSLYYYLCALIKIIHTGGTLRDTNIYLGVHNQTKVIFEIDVDVVCSSLSCPLDFHRFVIVIADKYFHTPNNFIFVLEDAHFTCNDDRHSWLNTSFTFKHSM